MQLLRRSVFFRTIPPSLLQKGTSSPKGLTQKGKTAPRSRKNGTAARNKRHRGLVFAHRGAVSRVSSTKEKQPRKAGSRQGILYLQALLRKGPHPRRDVLSPGGGP